MSGVGSEMAVEPSSPRRTLLAVGVFGVAALFSLAYSVVAARLLDRAEFSDFAAALAVVTLLGYVAAAMILVVTEHSSRYAARGEWARVGALYRHLSWRALAAGVLVLIAGAALAPYASRLLNFRSPWPLVAALFHLCFLITLTIPRATLRGSHRFVAYSTNIFAEAGLRLVLGGAMLAIADTAFYGVIAYAIASLGALALSVAQLRDLPSQHEPPDVDVWKSVTPAALLLLIFAAFQNLDMLFVKHAFSRETAGVYAAAVALARSMSIVVMPFEAMLVPLLAKARTEKKDQLAIVARLAAYSIAAAAAPLAAFAFFPREITQLLFGAFYAGAAPFLLPLSVAAFLSYVTYVMGQSLLAAGERRFLAVYLALLGVEIVALSLFHASPGEIVVVVVGASAATAVVLGAAVWRSTTAAETRAA
jgi:O-antigen/teichoic acid export membrane protein